MDTIGKSPYRVAKRLGLYAAASLALAACAPYSLVEIAPTEIGTVYVVNPQINWSRLDRGGVELWTVNGHALEAIRFFNEVGDGESLYQPTNPEQSLPTFQKGMTPSDVQDLVVDTIAADGGLALEAQGLTPIPFGSHPGFRFEVRFKNSGGLEMNALVAGSIIGGRLNVLLFTAPRSYYFPRYRPAVEGIISSIRTKA